jgi:hypothetical protein
MVQREGLVDKLSVTADGTGLVGHAGSVLVAGVADRVGLTRCRRRWHRRGSDARRMILGWCCAIWRSGDLSLQLLVNAVVIWNTRLHRPRRRPAPPTRTPTRREQRSPRPCTRTSTPRSLRLHRDPRRRTATSPAQP